MKACASCASTRVDAGWRCQDCGYGPHHQGPALSFVPDGVANAGGFHPDMFRKLALLEAKSFWFVARNALITWAVRRYFPRARVVLEVGCGTGFVLGALADTLPVASITGTEVFPDGLEFARARAPSADLYQVDARRLPFRDHFDLIAAFDVLEHIDEDNAVLEQMHSALTSGGGLLLTVPQHPRLWSRQDELAYHKRRYTAAGLRRQLTDAGFEVSRVTSFVSLLLPAMVLRRFAPSGTSTADGIDGLAVARPLDRLLGFVMGIERLLIEHGLSFPAGGSLLVVARRKDRA